MHPKIFGDRSKRGFRCHTVSVNSRGTLLYPVSGNVISKSIISFLKTVYHALACPGLCNKKLFDDAYLYAPAQQNMPVCTA